MFRGTLELKETMILTWRKESSNANDESDDGTRVEIRLIGKAKQGKNTARHQFL